MPRNDEEVVEDDELEDQEDGDEEEDDDGDDEPYESMISEIDYINIGDIYESLEGEGVSNNSPITKNKILGLPPAFDANTDPDHRAFSESIMYDMPVVNIIPGTPRFLGIDGDGIHTDKAILDDMIGEAFTEGDADSIRNYLTNAKGSKDFRYYAFKANYTEYFQYVQQMLSIVSVNMGLGMMYNFSESLESTFTEGSSIPFYLSKATNISESASNDFGPSQLEGALKSASGIKKEIDFLMGKNMDVADLEEAAANDEESTGLGAKVRGIFEHLDELTLKGGVDKVKTVFNGSHMLFPEIWQDSSFTRNYTLQFVFQTPYGTPRSVFNRVYVPFIALLALTLPRQDTLFGYSSPFLVKMDAPGWFNTSMGVITSMDFVKGGDEKLWTTTGLPTEIRVTLNVKDLYPALMISKSYSALVSNVGIGNYLNNMAGISVLDINPSGQLKGYIQSKVNSMANIYRTPISKFKDLYANYVQDMKSGVLERFKL